MRTRRPSPAAIRAEGERAVCETVLHENEIECVYVYHRGQCFRSRGLALNAASFIPHPPHVSDGDPQPGCLRRLGRLVTEAGRR